MSVNQMSRQTYTIGLEAASGGIAAYACCAVLTSINPVAAAVYTATNIAVAAVVIPIFKEKLKEVPLENQNIFLTFAVVVGTPIAAGLCATKALGYSFTAKAVIGTFFAVKIGTLLAIGALFAAFLAVGYNASAVKAN